MTRDIGNDAMLAAADRHYNALYSDECECRRCSDPVSIDEAEIWDGDEYYCDWCLDKIIPRWAEDFVREVLFEDEGERSTFFPIKTTYQYAAE